MKLMQDNRGFSLIELLMSLVIMLVVLALASRALFEAMRAEEAIGLMADSNQNLQSAQTMMVRDMIDAGRNIPVGSLSLPTGGQPIVRPGPANAAAAGWPAPTPLYPVTPGDELGPVINGNTTDTITIVSVDDVMRPGSSSVVVDGNGATVTMTAGVGTSVATNSGNTPRVGDLMLLSRASSVALVYVTGVDANPLVFTAATAGDPTMLNQQGATASSIPQLGSGASTKVQRIKMTTYWVEESNGMPYLMRQENYRAPVQVGLGIDNLELWYDVFAGGVVTRVANVFTELAGATPNQFDKGYVTLQVRSDKKFGATKGYLRNDLTTQVSFRSLQVQQNFR